MAGRQVARELVVKEELRVRVVLPAQEVAGERVVALGWGDRQALDSGGERVWEAPAWAERAAAVGSAAPARGAAEPPVRAVREPSVRPHIAAGPPAINVR